ncbi:MAG: helix-turn-helix domain-containing protein [Gammaproteobacteria bacterium]
MDIFGFFWSKIGSQPLNLVNQPSINASPPDLRAEPILCALQDRTLGIAFGPAQRHRRAVLLTSGKGLVATPDGDVPFLAPCLAWLPWQAGSSLKIKAGSTGFQMAVGDEVLVGAIGNDSESVNLRYLADRNIIAPLDEEPEIMADAEHAFDLVVRELHRPRNGAWTMVLAQVRTLLVFLWRLSGVEELAMRSQGEPSRILQRFRQLVEMHFRDRWPVKRYAAEINISHDRLHDICRRKLGKTPLQLIHERTLYEARLRLERSTLSVDQVASSLGFSDVSHFSRFFKSKVGLPPAAYREKVALSIATGDAVTEHSFADWP